MKIGVILFALLPTITLAEATAPNLEAIEIQNVISAVGPSWNTAGNFKAVLMREGEYAALYIFRNPYDQTPLAYAPHVAITGDYWDTIPWLEFDEGGTLLLHSENQAYGHTKWGATLSIIERNGQFIVSAYTINAYNSINPDDYTDCNIDFLAQTLTINSINITPFPLPATVHINQWPAGVEEVCYKDPENL